MSDAGNPPSPAPNTPPPESYPPPSPPRQRNGCLTAIMVLAGVIMLLPGLCALLFGGMSLTQARIDPTITPFVMMGLLVGFGGIALIWVAIKGAGR